MTLQLMNETSASAEARVMSATQKKQRGRPTDRPTDRLLQYRGNEMRNAEEEEEDGQEEEEGEAAAAAVGAINGHTNRVVQ